MSRRGPCADCDPSTASTASVSSDLHKYHVACTCGGVAQYAECASVGPPEAPSPTSGPGSIPTTKEPRPPALPPRPPPRPRPRNAQGGTARSDGVQSSGGSTTTSNVGVGSGGGGVGGGSGPKKYVWWCLGMGTTACLLGGLLLAAAMLLRAHTDSLHHLETIPTPVPASMLVATGLCIMSLARRRNRYSYLIKVVGACCLVCALTCVLVTITTTVIHMNRLQTLRKCVYTEKTKTCTCYSVLADGQNTNDDEEGVKCVFESVMDCGTVHGALYKCLGAVFGLSVAGVLVCICSAMLAYQLLSHERKKMYWEQLELRCRSLYRPANNNSTGTNNNQPTNNHPQQPPVCDECCAECRAAAAVSWDIQHRFWASGRVGNLYSPNPGTGRRVSAWSWFPWPRNSNQRVGGSTSGDSAYGFGNTPAGYWQLGPPPPYTPHHRYLHHHIQQQQQANSLHHHHMQGAASMGVATGTLNSRHRGAQHTRRGCHDSHQHAPVPEDFSEELEDIHQHTCQKYQHAVPEQEEGVAIQGTENLAFQCEKQSPQRQQARSGESELYFADVSSCCNVSLKAIEYCGGGLIGTIDSQADSSSGESDGQTHPHHRKPHHHNGHHGQGMGACSQSPRRPRIKNSNLQHADNRLHRSCEMSCRTNLMLSRGEVHYMDNSKDMCQGPPGAFHCNNPECSQMLACGDDPTMRSSEMLRRISENNEELDSPSMQCSLNGGMCQNSGNFNCNNTPDRSSMRVRQSPNRSSFICRQQSPIRANCVGLPTSSPNSFPPNESENFVNSQMRRRDSRDENIVNYGGATSSLAQIRRRNDEDCDVRRQTIEKELLGLDNSCKSYKRKPIDENLLNDSAMDAHIRRQAIEDAILNNSLEMLDEGALASMRRTALEDSILNCSVNQTITGLLNKSHEDQSDSQMMKRKAIDESMLCGDDVSFSPIRRKDLEDSLTKDQNISMSPLRRRVLEDSINNELNISLSSIRRKAIEDSINNELNASTPLRRKGEEQNISLSQIRKNKREDSISSEELNVSAPRRKVNNDSVSNNEQNMSMSPLRRRVLEEKINNDCANISLTRKAIEDLNNENQTKALDDLLNNDPNVMARRKGIDEILNSQLDASMHNIKSNLSHIVQSDKYSPNFNSSMRDRELEDSLTSEVGGSRRGIIQRACLGPDVRYEPVQVFGNECVGNDDVGTQNPVHLRCCSDSNTMDSGWQSGSEKHITD